MFANSFWYPEYLVEEIRTIHWVKNGQVKTFPMIT